MISVRNGEAYIKRCLEHLSANGVFVVLIDHASEDQTLRYAQPFMGRTVIDLQYLAWEGYFDLSKQLEAKISVMDSLQADWLIHQDVDEILVSDRSGESLADAFLRVQREGYNSVNFDEFVFVPENENVHYEGTDYIREMRHYYFFEPRPRRLMRAWKSGENITLSVDGGGHLLRGMCRVYSHNFILRHYMHLSWEQVLHKYPTRKFDPSEVAIGWHYPRVNVKPENLHLPPLSTLKYSDPADLTSLDRSDPKKTHFWCWQQSPDVNRQFPH